MAAPGSKPTILEILTLGRSPQLGELYNERTSQFLDYRMYDEEKMKGYTVKTDVNHTELSLSMANSFEDKATVLDIGASLSVQVLGGLIDVKGSAEYLKDVKSNTKDTAWAMSLKMRLSEKRLLFAQKDLAGNVLEFAKDYIAQGEPTHFVSSVVYGGNIVVNLVARSSNLTEEEKISGKLQIVLDKLKGAVDLDATAQVEISDELKSLQDKFEFVLHGDVILATTPTTVEGVLKTLQQTRDLLKDGVPISATLQPIPDELLTTARLIYHLERKKLEEILRLFGDLDDIDSRFKVLQQTASTYKDSIPDLVSRIRDTFDSFSDTYGVLTDELNKFIREFLQSGRQPEESSENKSLSEEKKKTLFERAKDLSDEQRQVKKAPTDPDTLADLEHEYSDFQDFVAVVRGIGLRLNGLPEVKKAVINQPVIGLFLMPLLTSISVDHLLSFSSLARAGTAAYSREDPAVPTYVLFVENPATLEKNLPSGGQFAKVNEPALFRGTKTEISTLSWVPVKFTDVKTQVLTELYDFSFGLTINTFFTVTERQLTGLDSSGPFTIMTSGFCVNPATDPKFSRAYMSVRQNGVIESALEFLLIKGSFEVFVGVGGKLLPMSQGKGNPLGPNDVPISAAFVQDPATKKWLFYFDGVKINERPISPDAIKDKLVIQVPMLDKALRWRGNVFDIQVYSKALTEKEIETAYLAHKRQP